MNTSTKYLILLIDDDTSYSQVFSEHARQNGIRVLHATSLEAGEEILRKHRVIQAVVLDSHCKIDSDQRQDEVKSNFMIHAINCLHELEHETNRHLPFCFNTEKPNDISEDLEGIAMVFSKTIQHPELFDHLQRLIDNTPETAAIKEHQDVFDFFSTHLSEEDTELLLDLLLNLDKSDDVSIISNLTIIRRLEESLASVIFEKLKLLPGSKITGRFAGQTKQVFAFLYSENIIDKQIKENAEHIYYFCSKYGNHKAPVIGIRIKFLPGVYTVKSLCFELFELILFLRRLSFLENNSAHT